MRVMGKGVLGLDVDGCEPDDLQVLTAGVRDGRAALDRLLIQVGATAHRHEQQHGKGRGAQGTMLGDGSKVRGATARRETDRAHTATNLDRVGTAVDQGRIGAAQVDAITHATKELTPKQQQQQLNTDELIDAAESLSADLFARRVRDRVEQIKGDHGLSDTKTRQARSSWKHWIDKHTGMGRVCGEFDPERYESIVSAIETQHTRLANHSGVTKTSNLAAQAAFELLTGNTRSTSEVPHINVIVDLETLQHGAHQQSVHETAGGHPLPPESITRPACDAVLQRVAIDHHRVSVDVDRKHRTATPSTNTTGPPNSAPPPDNSTSTTPTTNTGPPPNRTANHRSPARRPPNNQKPGHKPAVGA